MSYEHHSTRPEVRTQLEAAVATALEPNSSYAKYVKDVKYAWEGDKVVFSLRAMGSNIKGSVEVTDTEVIVDVGLPLMFRAFEGKAKSRILRLLGETVG
ncbi:MAG: polyhydroxyalkanoic acid system family protein [Chloroflexi bacterium]|nr:polyhydroxyalkanoic acid system family protein [Chloroflexota bacterium]